MQLSHFSNNELINGLELEFEIERKTNHNILLYLKEIYDRRAYAERGYKDLCVMLIQHFKQSETAANQRLKALQLILDVPVTEERLISGDLNMSTVAMAQRRIRKAEKITGKSLTPAKKAEIVDAITGKTMASADIELFKLLPETAVHLDDVERRISADAVRISVTLPNDVREMMQRLKDLWAHVDHSMDNVEVMRRAFKIALDKCDPTRKRKMPRATESAKHRSTKRLSYYGTNFDRELWERAGSQCEYIDENSGHRCDSKSHLQHEHIIPPILGGTNELSNMILLCRTHNQLRARQIFGNKKIDAYIKRTQSGQSHATGAGEAEPSSHDD